MRSVVRRLARIVAKNLARNVTCGSAFSTFFPGITFACLRAQSCEECCEETSEECCEECFEECHVCKCILDLFCSGALEGCPEKDP